MPRTIRDLMPNDFEFQMFVLDELSDDLIEQGADILKLTIGVSELPMPELVLEARDILETVHVAVVPGTDFGVPHDLRLAFCNDRYNEGIDRLRNDFTSSVADSRSAEIHQVVTAAKGGDA